MNGESTGGRLAFHYGHPDLRYRSTLSAVGEAAWTTTGSRIATRIELQSQQAVNLGLHLQASAADGTTLADDRAGANAPYAPGATDSPGWRHPAAARHNKWSR